MRDGELVEIASGAVTSVEKTRIGGACGRHLPPQISRASYTSAPLQSITQMILPPSFTPIHPSLFPVRLSFSLFFKGDEFCRFSTSSDFACLRLKRLCQQRKFSTNAATLEQGRTRSAHWWQRHVALDRGMCSACVAACLGEALLPVSEHFPYPILNRLCLRCDKS